MRVSGQRDAAARAWRGTQQPAQVRAALRLHRRQCAAGRLRQRRRSIDCCRDAGLPIWGRERPATLVVAGRRRSRGGDRAGSARRRQPANVKRLRGSRVERGLPLDLGDSSRRRWIRQSTQTPGGAASTAQLQQTHSDTARTRRSWAVSAAGSCGLDARCPPTAPRQAAGGLEDGVHLAADAFARAVLCVTALRSSDVARRSARASRSQRLRVDAELSGIHDAGAQRCGRTGRRRHPALPTGRARRRRRRCGGRLRSTIAWCRTRLPRRGSAAPVDRLSFRYQPLIMRHHSECAVRAAHVAGGCRSPGCWRVGNISRRSGCSASLRRPTVSMAFSPNAAAGPRSSARFSIRWPTRFCSSASSSRSAAMGLVPVWLAVAAVGRDVIITERRDRLQGAVWRSARATDADQQAQYAVPDSVSAARRCAACGEALA